MKNLILFHLESINNIFLYMRKDSFKNLNKIMGYSTVYTKYYSTATSTFMVISDLLYGTTKIFEDSTTLEGMYSISPKGESLFEELYKKGYKTSSFYIGKDVDFGRDIDSSQYLKIMYPSCVYYNPDDEKDFETMLRNEIISSGLFSIHVVDERSHISEVCKQEKSSYEFLEYRFEIIDKSIGTMLRVLEETKHLDDTLIVFYGDHGDELLYHGLHEGLTHAFEPYSSMISCPLIVYNPTEKKTIVTDELISTINLKSLISHLLEDEKESINNEFVFSRNQFRAQGLRTNWFNKSYCVVNNQYMLIVSSLGFEMYVTNVDYSSNFNLLNFFKYKNGKIEYNEIFNYMRGTHISNYLNEHEIANIETNFISLKNALENELYDKYLSLGKMNFSKIRFSEWHNKQIRILNCRKVIIFIKTIVKKILRVNK